MLDGQSSASLNAPLTEMLEMVTGPRALNVIVCGVLVLPTLVSPKARLPLSVLSAGNAEMLRTRKLFWSDTRIFPTVSTAVPAGAYSNALVAGPPSPLYPAFPLPAMVVMKPEGLTQRT